RLLSQSLRLSEAVLALGHRIRTGDSVDGWRGPAVAVADQDSRRQRPGESAAPTDGALRQPAPWRQIPAARADDRRRSRGRPRGGSPLGRHELSEYEARSRDDAGFPK